MLYVPKNELNSHKNADIKCIMDCTGIGFEDKDEDAAKLLFFAHKLSVNRLTTYVNRLMHSQLATKFLV